MNAIKLIRFTVILLLFFPCSEALAQPGYMGRKWTAGYSFEWGIRESLASGQSDRLIGHHFRTARTINRRNEFAGHIAFYSPDYVYQDSRSWRYRLSSTEFKARELHFEIGYRHYLRDFVAPVGVYLYFGVDIVTGWGARSNPDVTFTPIDDDDGEAFTKEAFQGKMRGSKYSYGMGFKRVIHSNIYMDFEGMLSYRLWAADLPDVPEDEAYLSNNFFYNFNSTILGFRLGFGVLL